MASLRARLRSNRGASAQAVSRPLSIKFEFFAPSVNMSEALKTLFNNPDDSDLQIQLHSGEILYVHRLILKTCSPVFNAMFAGGWRDAECAKLQFQNSDIAVRAVIRNMYTGDMRTVKLYKTMKFAMYLQMDDLVRYLIRNVVRNAPDAARVKIGMLVDGYDHKMYKLCVPYMFWTTSSMQTISMNEVHGIVLKISAAELEWVIGKVDDDFACLLQILYGHYHQDPELAIRAVRGIDMQSLSIKRSVRRMCRWQNFPEEYKTMIIEMFAKCPRMVSTCGCVVIDATRHAVAINAEGLIEDTDVPSGPDVSMYKCKQCDYEYCDHCAIDKCANGYKCHGNYAICPRCQFMLKTYNAACSVCSEHAIRMRKIVYCSACQVLSQCPINHKQHSALVLDVDGTMQEFRRTYADSIGQIHTRLEWMVWRHRDTAAASVNCN